MPKRSFPNRLSSATKPVSVCVEHSDPLPQPHVAQRGVGAVSGPVSRGSQRYGTTTTSLFLSSQSSSRMPRKGPTRVGGGGKGAPPGAAVA